MTLPRRDLLVGAAAALTAGAAAAQQAGPRPDPYAGKKKLLFIADYSTGHQTAHESSTSRALATLSETLRRAGYAVFLRTDTRNVTKREVYGAGDYAAGGSKQSRGRNLDFYDGIILYLNGEPNLDAEGRAALLSFLAEDGKGLVGIHTATSTGYYWPEYGRMIGGYFDNHPWNVVDARVIVERPDFPGMEGFVREPRVRDEMYAMTAAPFSRENVDVLMRLDTQSVDMGSSNVRRTDGDFPQAWIKSYGKGRVFYSALGHPDSSWDDPRIQQMYLQAARWAIGDLAYPVRPHRLDR